MFYSIFYLGFIMYFIELENRVKEYFGNLIKYQEFIYKVERNKMKICEYVIF